MFATLAKSVAGDLRRRAADFRCEWIGALQPRHEPIRVDRAIPIVRGAELELPTFVEVEEGRGADAPEAMVGERGRRLVIDDAERREQAIDVVEGLRCGFRSISPSIPR